MTTEDSRLFRSRLTDSVETALKFGEGYLTVTSARRPQIQPDDREKTRQSSTDPGDDLHFSEHLACPEHGISLPEIEPRTFSFNTPHGACPDCQGLGSKLEIDPDLLIPDTDLSLNEGAIVAMEWSGPRRKAAITGRRWKPSRSDYQIDLDAPVKRAHRRRSWT